MTQTRVRHLLCGELPCHATPRDFPCSVVISSYLITFTVLPYSKWLIASAVPYGMQSVTFELWYQRCTVRPAKSVRITTNVLVFGLKRSNK